MVHGESLAVTIKHSWGFISIYERIKTTPKLVIRRYNLGNIK